MTVRLIPSLRTDRFAALDRAVLAAVQSAGGNSGKVRLPRYTASRHSATLTSAHSPTTVRLSDIKRWFFIFSPRVLSQSITRLVNAQLLQLNSARAELSIAPAVSAIFDRCNGRVFNIKDSETVLKLLEVNNGRLAFPAFGELRKFNASFTQYILSGLFTDLDLSYYKNYVEFTCLSCGGGND